MAPNVDAELRERSRQSVAAATTAPFGFKQAYPEKPWILKKDKGVVTEHEEEIMIDGVWYNVKDFAKRHPGGRIVNFYKGKDATEAYREFHMRSTKADKWLKSIPSRPDNGKSKLASDLDPLTRDFAKLRAEFVAEGKFEPSIPHVAYRLAEVVAMHAAGFYLMLNAGYPILGLVVLGVTQGRCGWLMHEGGHHSLTGYIPVDIAIQIATYGVGCGMSASFWRNQHNKHHATPQKINHDVDLDTLPLVAFNVACKKTKMGKFLNKYWVRLQGLLFAPLTCLIVALGWQAYLHPRHSLRTKNYAELAAMAARYALIWYVSRAYDISSWDVVKAYVFYAQVGASYIFCNFAVSHTHLPVLEEDEDVSWVRYSSDHTMNVQSGLGGWVDWWMSYLNFQIEHHLFPSMPQFRHPEISPRVKALFEKHGVKYDNREYFSAMYDTFANLDNVGADIFYG